MENKLWLTGLFVLLLLLSSFKSSEVAPYTTMNISFNDFINEDTPDFSKFPLSKAQIIEVSFPEELEEELSSREQLDQMRDWLMYSIVNNISLSDITINKILHDVPLIRYGANRAIYDLEYGEIRSKLLPGNLVVALIPKGTSEKQLDAIAHIADYQRKNIGNIPEEFIVFEYTLNPNEKTAELTRTKSLSGKEVFSPSYLYYETKVSTLQELEYFMDKIQDLTYVEQIDQALMLGGRSLKHRTYKNIRVEDIAAIWQAETKRTIQGTGFSLDPAYDFEGLKKLVHKYPTVVTTALRESDFSAKYYEPNISPRYKAILFKLIKSVATDSEIISFVKEELVYSNPEPLFYIYDYTLSKKYIYLKYKLEEFKSEFKKHRFQTARYDGAINGTEVGMILYYTDLLGKIWSFNYEWTTPQKQIAEFLSFPENKLSKIYEAESRKFNQGRLWLGPNENGIQKSTDKTLLFARNITKIFVAAQDGMSATSEVPASASIAKPIHWWNNHYEEVAAFESQYEALNEIMKWSTVIVWLNNRQESQYYLSYLNRNKVNVKKEYWFPDWAENNPSLRFNQWDSIGFYPRGYKGTANEGLPILNAPPNRYGGPGGRMSGGVTLAEPSTIAKIIPTNQLEVNKLLLRGNIKNSRGENSYESIKNTAFKIENNSVTAKPSIKSRLRNNDSEFSKQTYQKQIENQAGEAKFTSSYNEVPLGDLNISPSNNGIKVGFKSRSLRKGNHLSRKLSDAEYIETVLKESIEVNDYYTIRNGKRYIIELKDSENWLEIEIAEKPDVLLDAKWDSRTAGFKRDSKVIRQKWITAQEARMKAKSYGIVGTKRTPTSNPPKILEDYIEINPGRNADDFLTENKTLKDQISQFFKEELTYLDVLLESPDNHFLFEKRIARLEHLYGEKPALILRKTLYDLSKELPEAPEKLVHEINELTLDKSKEQQQLFNEINKTIANAPINSKYKKALKEHLDFNSGKSKVLVIEGEASLNSKTIKNKEKVLKDLAKNKNKILLVEDHPSINNLNFHSSPNKTLASIIELTPDIIQIRKVSKKELKKYRPELNIKKIPPSLPPTNGTTQNGGNNNGFSKIRTILVRVGPSTVYLFLVDCDEEEEDCEGEEKVEGAYYVKIVDK